MTMGEFIIGWFGAIWQFFTVPLYNGITASGILFGVLFISLLIWFFHTFFKRES